MFSPVFPSRRLSDLFNPENVGNVTVSLPVVLNYIAELNKQLAAEKALNKQLINKLNEKMDFYSDIVKTYQNQIASLCRKIQHLERSLQTYADALNHAREEAFALNDQLELCTSSLQAKVEENAKLVNELAKTAL